MKHCPNPNCPFLHQFKMVAEFRDNINTCPDCGTPLVPGEAPEVEVLEGAEVDTDSQLRSTGYREQDLVTLCTVSSEADAAFYKEQLELQGIPAIIVATAAATNDEAIGEKTPHSAVVIAEAVQDEEAELAAQDDAAEGGLFDVQVLRANLLLATQVLNSLDDEESEEDEEGDEDAERRTSAPRWVEPMEDNEPVQPVGAAPINPTATPSVVGGVSEKPSSSLSPMLLIVLLVIVVLFIGLFLLNTLAK